MARRFLSLREIGRQLDIPPSTVVYYKDKFSRYIPAHGSGRRRRYPAEALEVFRRIREMFDNHWSAAEVERELALKFNQLMQNVQDDEQLSMTDAAPGRQAQELAGSLAGVLEKMADVLENQSLFRSEIRSLRDEVAALRAENEAVEQRREQELDDLKRELDELRKRGQRLERRMGAGPGAGMPQFPSSAFLARPMVVRTEGGEYYGVLGQDKKHFSLKEFVDLVECSCQGGRSADIVWDHDKDRWTLSITVADEGTSVEQAIVLVATKTVTPSRNTVTEVQRLNINGRDVPETLMLSLFKQLRDGFRA